MGNAMPPSSDAVIVNLVSERGYPLPDIQNPGSADVVRIATALRAIDHDISTQWTDMHQRTDSNTAKQVALQQQLDDLSFLIYAGLL